MLYSFNLKGSEIHIFLVNKIEAFYKPGFLPHPHCSMLSDVRWQGIQYFSMVTGVRGMIFLQGFNFVVTILSKILVSFEQIYHALSAYMSNLKEKNIITSSSFISIKWAVFFPFQILVFYFIRCFLGLTCAICELYFYR